VREGERENEPDVGTKELQSGVKGVLELLSRSKEPTRRDGHRHRLQILDHVPLPLETMEGEEW
jgi:hypothetical protein